MLTNQTKKVQNLIQPLMSARQAEKFIKMLQDDIEEIAKELTPKLADLKVKEEEYFNLKAIVNKSQEELEENKRSLENIIRQRDNVPKSKDAHTMRPTSHLNADKRKPRIIPGKTTRWMDEFRTILESEQKFMTAQQLVDGYFKRFPDRKKDQFYAKGALNARANITRAALQTRQAWVNDKLPRKGSAELLDYDHQEMIYYGIREWFDDNLTPLPKFMAQFAYTNGNVPHAKSFT